MPGCHQMQNHQHRGISVQCWASSANCHSRCVLWVWTWADPASVASTRPLHTKWAKKTGLFLSWDNFAMTNDRKPCNTVSLILSRMSVHLNILCLICINHQYPQNCIEFDNDVWVLLNFQSKYSETRTISNTQTKFNMSTLCLDNHRQSFWQLINRSVQCVLA